MAINIVEAVQSSMGISSVKKIDVNATHQSLTKHPEETDFAAQAATAAVLVGLYRYGKTDEGAAMIAQSKQGNWLQSIFMNKEDVAAHQVALYSGITEDEARNLMTRVADEAIKVVHENAGDHPTKEKVKTYIASQRHNVLAYLPAELEMGKVLNDDTLDDRTNKMEGPVSSFLHWIENLMSPQDVTDEEAFKREDEFWGRKTNSKS
jgi:hypothetical protein